MFPSKAFDRLVQAGKPVGSLRISDLGRVLPVETMTVDEITEVVSRLEGAGIPVEIDAELEVPYHRKTASHSKAVSEQSSLSNAKSTDHVRWEALASSIKDKLRNRAPQHQNNSDTVFVIAAALILIVLALVALIFTDA